MLNLDTHILLRALTDDLTARERGLLAGDEWSICDIVIWEIAKLAQLGRIELDLDDREFTRLISQLQV
jgi:PIN domain nuclease of toxin-antitoxin system